MRLGGIWGWDLRFEIGQAGKFPPEKFSKMQLTFHRISPHFYILLLTFCYNFYILLHPVTYILLQLLHFVTLTFGYNSLHLTFAYNSYKLLHPPGSPELATDHSISTGNPQDIPKLSTGAPKQCVHAPKQCASIPKMVQAPIRCMETIRAGVIARFGGPKRITPQKPAGIRPVQTVTL